MKMLKLLTKSGRQELVKVAAKEYLTPDRIAELVADGVAKALEAGAEKMTDERCAQIALGCQVGGTALIHITAAVDPHGEEGKKVSAIEKALIASDIKTALSNLITQDGVDAAIDKAAMLVP